jgi:tRNA(Arg) A34 adenosine deaminase TadA
MIHKYENSILLDAIEIAKKSNMRSKHRCIIIDNKGYIISKACNRTLNVSKDRLLSYNKDKKVSSHAEENALRNVDPKKLHGAKLYVVRWRCVDSNPIFMNSKPCSKCTSIIISCMKKFGLKVAYYSTSDTNN